MSPIRYGSTNCLFLPMCTLNGDRRHTASISQFQRETRQRILVDAVTGTRTKLPPSGPPLSYAVYLNNTLTVNI